MIDQLPPANRLNEAIANDPEWAELIASQPDPKGDWHPAISEFGIVPKLLREVLGGINHLQETLVAVNGGTPKPHKAFPVPYTEIDRIRDAQDKQFIVDIAGLFGFGPEDLF
jgi:hypothetical protein